MRVSPRDEYPASSGLPAASTPSTCLQSVILLSAVAVVVEDEDEDDEDDVDDNVRDRARSAMEPTPPNPTTMTS